MAPRAPSAAVEGLLYSILIAAPLAFGCVEPWSEAGLEICLFFLALLCLFRPKEESEAPRSRLLLLVPAGFILLGLLQVLHPVAPDGPRGTTAFTADPQSTLRSVLLWASYGSLIWAVPRIARKPSAARRFSWMFFTSGFTVALLGLIQKIFSEDGRIYGVRYTNSSVFGPYYNADHAASLMVMSLFIGAGIWQSRWRLVQGSRPGRMAGFLPTEFLLIQGGVTLMIGLLVAGIVSCGSLGATLSFLSTCWIMAFLSLDFLHGSRKRRAIFALLALTLPLAAWVLYSYINTSLSLMPGSSRAFSTRDRMSIYASGWRMFKDFPVFGSGLGTFARLFPAYHDLSVGGIVEHAHNDWLETALDTGSVGLALYGAVWLAFIVLSVKTWHKARSREMRCLMGGAIAALIAFLGHGLVEFNSHIPANAAAFLALAGWLGAGPAWADKPAYRRAQSGDHRVWTLYPAVAIFAGLIALSARPAVAFWRMRQADIHLEERPRYMLRVLDWDDRPQYQYLTGLSYYDMGELNPASARSALRLALPYSLRALRTEPMNPQFLYLNAAILWRLGAKEDAGLLAGRGLITRFELLTARPEAEYKKRARDLNRLRKLDILPEERRFR